MKDMKCEQEKIGCFKLLGFCGLFATAAQYSLGRAFSYLGTV